MYGRHSGHPFEGWDRVLGGPRYRQVVAEPAQFPSRVHVCVCVCPNATVPHLTHSPFVTPRPSMCSYPPRIPHTTARALSPLFLPPPTDHSELDSRRVRNECELLIHTVAQHARVGHERRGQLAWSEHALWVVAACVNIHTVNKPLPHNPITSYCRAAHNAERRPAPCISNSTVVD